MIQHTNFYPRSPCGERRPASHLSKFNTSYFYPRSPCGERLTSSTVIVILYNFYPRSPCGERLVHALKFADFMLFLSTLSLRRATQGLQVRACQSEISIHALLAESDQKWPKHQTQTQNFYPRSPCGERRCSARCRYWVLSISIHALLAESDGQKHINCWPDHIISIHALLAESDLQPCCTDTTSAEFLSTLSLRRATQTAHQ